MGYWNQSSTPPPFAPDSIMNMCRNFHVDYLLPLELRIMITPGSWRRDKYHLVYRLYDKEQGEPVDSVKISFKLDQEKLGEFDNIPECIRNSFWEAGMISGRLWFLRGKKHSEECILPGKCCGWGILF